MGYVIVTRYHGPTNYRGSRVIGTGPAVTMDDARDGRYTRATVDWDYGASNGTGRSESDVMHRRAAEAVAAKLAAAGWRVTLAPGDGATLPDDSGRVFTLRYDADREPHAILTCDCADPASHAAPAPETFRPACYVLGCRAAALPDRLGCERHPHAEDN